MESKSNRKTILINRAFQSRLIFHFAVVNAVLLVFFAFLIFLFLDSEISANLAQAHTDLERFSDLLFPIVLALSLIQVLLSTALISIVVLYASHRIAGPVFRMQKVLESLNQKDLRLSWKLRQNDQFTSLSEELKTFTTTLDADISRAQHLSEEALSHATDDNQRQQLESLSALLESYKTRTESYDQVQE